MNREHPAYVYAEAAAEGRAHAPLYVVKQCKAWLEVADGENDTYMVSEEQADRVDRLLGLVVMHKGLKAGQSVREALSGFQWLLIIGVICTVYRDNPKRRRYETALLEICRKNGKTFLVAVLFLLLFLLEPKFSKFYSVAPDGSLSREIKSAMEEIIKSSPALAGRYKGKEKFTVLRDTITCNLKESSYVPLNYSTSRLDGRLPSAFLADEVGALPNPYALEAMRSGQLTILNKLGFVISTKYPRANNPFEDEVTYAKRVLDGTVEDDKVFALLYEPDNPDGWMTDDEVLAQGNPLALDLPEIMEDLKGRRAVAIELPSKRENFLTKHCNIIYQGEGTECYIPIADVQACKVPKIDWRGMEVYLGVDLSMTNDNCAVAMAGYREGMVYGDVIAFVPEGRIPEKNAAEKINYYEFIEACKCIACGDRTVDYSVIEAFVLGIEKRYGVTVLGLGYDRYNALSSAQKWEAAGISCCEVRQHSSVLHPATKWLLELCTDRKFAYTENKLLEINFENARCTYDTNMNRYVNKKKSRGKVDMVVALINALYMLQQNVVFDTLDWVIQEL